MKQTKKLVTAAMFAALVCVATMSIRIPTPGTGGYIHPGDAVVILSGIYLSPAWAFLAAGIGSAMADLLGGYIIYVPVTFIIKGLAAFLGSYAFKHLKGHFKTMYPAVAAAGLIDMALVAGGYCFCETFLYGLPAALAGVPSNLLQGGAGLVISCALYTIPGALRTVRQLY